MWTPSAVTSVLFTAEHSDVDQQTLSFETLRYDMENGLLPMILQAYGLPLNEDPWDRKGYADIEQRETLELDGYSLNIDTAFGDVGFTSITSYREHQYDSRRDTSASQLRWAYDGDPEDVDRFSQEFRVAWSTPKTSFLFGAYYFDQTTSNLSFIDLGEDVMELLIGAPIFVSAGSDATTNTISYAAFGNITFALSERADMSIGLRYTRDEKEIDYSQLDPLGLFGGEFEIQAEDDWGEATPAFNVRYMFNENVRGYATIARGFKSGGFNDALGSADGIAFGPEYLWNYEIGLKNRFAQGKVTANFALFYMDWTDIQIVTDNPNTPNYDPIIQNAGAAHSTGLEGEVFAYPSRHWTIALNFSVMEAKYEAGTLPDGTPLDTMVRAPDYSANLNVEYRNRLSGSLEWFIGAEMLNTGELWLYPDNQPDSRVAPHTLYNARLGIGPEHRGWSFTVWGKNLTDEIYKERLFDLYDQPLIAQKYIVLNDPMMWGATLRFAF
jgi:iron complex outermembrane receptor protein